MKKIPSLFKRNYETNLVYDEVTEGCEWVFDTNMVYSRVVATIKIDGTCCRIKDGVLYKRYDRKLTKQANKIFKSNKNYNLSIKDFKIPPQSFEPCEPAPNKNTGHWPGWVKVNLNDKYHIEGFGNLETNLDGTYELIGPKVQGNPYKLDHHILKMHGGITPNFQRVDFYVIKSEIRALKEEGVVFWHDSGLMCKVKRKDFGFEWPIK